MSVVIIEANFFLPNILDAASHAPILSLTSHVATHTIVAGEELASYQAPILFWYVCWSDGT